jgi:SAM-dependent methyltransferase
MPPTTPADFWNERYAADGFAYGTAPNDFLAAQEWILTTPGPALCLAEGEGRNAVWLAQRGYQVTAVDLSEVGLAKARRMAEERGVTLATTVADLAHFPIEPNRYHVIVSIWCHVPPAVRAPLHRRVVRGLAPGGFFILEAYTPDQLQRNTGGPRDAQLLMSLSALRDELAGLRLLFARETTRHVVEGPHHTGEADVLQILAQKLTPSKNSPPLLEKEREG